MLITWSSCVAISSVLQMVTVETDSELWQNVRINQVPRNLSGNLMYDHSVWLDSMKVCVCVHACVRACMVVVCVRTVCASAGSVDPYVCDTRLSMY